MAKKPILTDDELDAGLGATPPPLPPAAGGATRPVNPTGAPASATRPLDATPPPPPAPDDAPAAPDASGRDASGHARPKTRIHGYGGPEREAADASASEEASPQAPAVGWLVITAGPGRGAAVSLISGMNAVGRGADCTAQIDFGDDTISREPHAFVTYDDETRMFHLSHGGRTNIVRLNDNPVLNSETLDHGASIRIGATTLRFVALCGPDFDWSDS